MSALRVRKRDYLLFLGFFVLWLLPISYVGIVNKPVPGAPNFCKNLYYVACLFPRRVGAWSEHYAQVQLSGGKNWVDVPNNLISQMEPFGHRNRIHRMIGASKSWRKNKSGKMNWYEKRKWLLRQRLAEYVKQRYETYSTADIEVIRVRFVSVTLSSSETLAADKQRWIELPRKSLRALRPESRQRTISTHVVSDRISGGVS